MKITDFSELYSDTCQQLVNLAMRFGINKEDAEDIVQDIMMVLWKKRDTLVFIEDMGGFLYKTTKNRCLDYLKHKACMKKYFQNSIDSYNLAVTLEAQAEWSSPADIIEMKETSHRIDDAVNDLPCRCREVFIMGKINGMKYKEISNDLGISVNTVECQMNIALKRIRRKLDVS